jgi:hypothetical protein
MFGDNFTQLVVSNTKVLKRACPVPQSLLHSKDLQRATVVRFEQSSEFSGVLFILVCWIA